MTDTVSTQDLLIQRVTEPDQQDQPVAAENSPTMQEKPEPSCVSMRSNQSIEQPVNLKNKGTYEHSRIQQARSESSEPSCVSGRSNQSIEQPVNMKDSVLQQDRSESQEPSCVSMRSNQSIEQPVNLKDSSEHSRIQQERSDSSEPSCVSVRNLSINSMVPVSLLKVVLLWHLDLTMNKVGDAGVKLLCAGLEDPHCKLDVLCLWNCGITDEGCADLASALRSNPSHMRELQLTRNKLGDSGVKHLSCVLKNCKLQKLRLNNCGITGKTVCAALASAVRSNPSHIRELYLSENKLDDSGVKLLFAVLENPQVKLEKIGLNNCGISDEGCVALTSALKSNLSHLRELQMTLNKLQHSGMKLLLSLLENDHCNMEKLWLGSCEITDEGCAALAFAPRSTPSNLTELDLSCNKLEVSVVKPLCVFMENSYCRLEKLRLNQCGIEDEGCAALACVLRSSTSLLNLNLSHNRLGNSGVKLLTAGLENPQCKLKTLILVGCNIKDEGCAALASALRSNPSHLKELNLNENRCGDSGVKLLCTALENPHCQLEVLWLSNCGVTDKGCDALAAALKSNPSYLRELDLFRNGLGYPGMNLLTHLKNSSDYNLDSLTF